MFLVTGGIGTLGRLVVPQLRGPGGPGRREPGARLCR